MIMDGLSVMGMNECPIKGNHIQTNEPPFFPLHNRTHESLRPTNAIFTADTYPGHPATQHLHNSSNFALLPSNPTKRPVLAFFRDPIPPPPKTLTGKMMFLHEIPEPRQRRIFFIIASSPKFLSRTTTDCSKRTLRGRPRAIVANRSVDA